MSADEQALLAGIAGGDDEALGRLYASYRPRLRRYLWQQLAGDTTAVEDVLQETFLAVWRTAGSFRDEAQVATWVFRIARYQMLRARRAAGHSAPGLLLRFGRDDDEADERDDVAEGMSASPEEAVVERLALAGALRRLSPKHREALELVFQQGFSLDETAQILSVPVGTVKSRISNGRRALQQELAWARGTRAIGEGLP